MGLFVCDSGMVYCDFFGGLFGLAGRQLAVYSCFLVERVVVKARSAGSLEAGILIQIDWRQSIYYCNLV